MDVDTLQLKYGEHLSDFYLHATYLLQINFLDYLAYIPLFLSMHDNMCVNPLDMRNTKYENRPASTQRDMNPLGYPLSKVNLFDQTKKVKVKVKSKDMQQQAKDILAGRVDQDAAKEEGVELYNKYKKYVC